MRPYKASNDYTRNCWYAVYYRVDEGAWYTLCDVEGNAIRFVTWSDACHAAKRAQRQDRPTP